MNTSYTSQDRGDKQSYQQYLEAMDAISVEKVASASMFFEPKRGNTIVDVGMASGTSTAILANLFPQLNVIGVDINPKMVEIARTQYQADNLSFRADDGEMLDSFECNSVDGFFNCSAIHHITSYNEYDINRALNTLKRQAELLKDKGILIVRDFVKPEEKEVILELSDIAKNDSPSDSELLLLFSKTARSLAPLAERGFPLSEVEPQTETMRRFRLFYSDAVEFIRRKDYYANWDIELQEEYGYLTQREFEDIFRSLGLRIIVSSPIYNPWIVEHRYKGCFWLYDLDGTEIGFPPTNYLIAGEKTNNGKELRLIRHLPQPELPFLKYSSFRNKETGQVYDVVKRPNDVIDFLPYYKEGQSITILAKHGYPRPLANARTDSPVIDGKYFSGYVTEGITIGKAEESGIALERRFGITGEYYDSQKSSLNYYTSPGGISERVSSVFISLLEKPCRTLPLSPVSSGFKDSGSLHTYDAAQLLNTAQTGALLEARLELNIYNLFKYCGLTLPKWLGERIEVKEEQTVPAVVLNTLLADKRAVFTPCESCKERAGFLATSHAQFMETGALGSSVALEYVYPSRLSSNTLITLPVCSVSGRLYVGLELRDLPVPQLLDGNSSLLTVPAKRLPKDVHDFFELGKYLSDMKIGDAVIERYFRLGEKYFPSIGITTEQVYPYVVWLDKPDEELKWVDIKELETHTDELRDAHLLTCLFRLRHALAI